MLLSEYHSATKKSTLKLKYYTWSFLLHLTYFYHNCKMDFCLVQTGLYTRLVWEIKWINKNRSQTLSKSQKQFFF